MRFFYLDRGQLLLLRKYWPFGLALGEIWGTALIIWGCSCMSAAVLAGAVLGLGLALRLGFLRQAAAVLLVLGLSAGLGAARAREERASLAVDPLLGLQHSVLAVRGRIAGHSKAGPEGMRALFLAEQTAAVPFNGCRDLLWRDLQGEVTLWLTWPGTRKYELGTRLELRGRLKAVEGGGGFADYCRRRGIRWSMRSEDIRQVRLG